MGLDMIGPYVDLVHVKNTRWERREDGTWRWRFDDLEDGQCNWPETMAALAETGYHGYLSFENLYRVPVRHKGYVAEDLTDWEGGPRDIDQRLAGELAYIRGLVEDA
jgi:sugar phosphate isomerase/epimerase